jgi:hypothetical protein
VVQGKVTGLEKDEVQLEPFKGSPKVAYKVAVIKIEKAIIGAKNQTHIKVVFPAGSAEAEPVNPDVPIKPIGRPFPGRGGPPVITLAADQEGVFFLHPHPTSNYYVIQPGFTPLNASDKTYKDELAKILEAATIFSEPLKALKSEKAESRLAAAAMLVQKYRSYPQNAQQVEQVAIPAEESQLILKELVSADWVKYMQDPVVNPMNAISQIGLYPGSNGIPQYKPEPGENNPNAYYEWYQAEIKKWYEKNGSKYEIKKNVAKK